MARVSAASTRFQMIGARATILNGPVAGIIDQQVQAIEDAVESVPDLAFDLAKALVESVCKTILEDIGRPANPKWDVPKIVKETTTWLSMAFSEHTNTTETRESISKTLNGLNTAVQGLCELRTNFGLASHGRDHFSARLGVQHATLAAQAADTIVAFLYRIHHDALTHAPRRRIYYDDYKEFNRSFDDDNEVIELAGLKLLPSRVLFDADREVYKAAVDDFIDEGNESSEDGASSDVHGGAEETTP